MGRTVSKRLESWFWRWAKRRVRAKKTLVLRHRDIYVFPSKAGFGFFVAVILLWLLGTNYENNLVLAASFFLISVFIISIVHAFRNLLGLQLTALAASPVFAGQRLQLPVRIHAQGRAAAGRLILASDTEHSVLTDVPAAGEVQVELSVATQQRGWHTPERILVQSYYPLGLLRAWCWVRFDIKLLVYPEPLPMEPRATSHSGEGEQHLGLAQGDDFIGLERYQLGAPLAHVAWKQYARGAGLHTKQFAAAQQDDLWLEYRAMTGDREARLSGLCYLALQWHRSGRQFGLRLQRECIAPASGKLHLTQVLSALALFELEAGEQ